MGEKHFIAEFVKTRGNNSNLYLKNKLSFDVIDASQAREEL